MATQRFWGSFLLAPPRLAQKVFSVDWKLNSSSKHLVGVAKKTGQLVLLTPLYQVSNFKELKFDIIFFEDKPLAYVVNAGPQFGPPQVLGPLILKWIKILGEL